MIFNNKININYKNQNKTRWPIDQITDQKSFKNKFNKKLKYLKNKLKLKSFKVKPNSPYI